MKAEAILSLFLRENFTDNCSSLFSKCSDCYIVEKFKIRQIFWDNTAISSTSKSRRCLWDKLINLRMNFIMKAKNYRERLKSNYFNELKDKLDPDLTLKFIDLILRNKDKYLILKFQKGKLY
jgi:hypothetical protein